MTWNDFRAHAGAQRKAGIFAAVVGGAVLVLFWPSGSSRARLRPVPVRQAPVPGGARFRPGRGTMYAAGAGALPGGVVAPGPDAPSLSAGADGILGKWESGGPVLLPKRGLCTLWLEIGKLPEQPSRYTGAASLSCTPSALLGGKVPDIPDQLQGMVRLNPLTATMSGEWDSAKHLIAYRVDRVLNGRDCPWTAFSAQKFGSQNLLVQWEDGGGGGSATLRQIR